jgi:hypothetical protein
MCKRRLQTRASLSIGALLEDLEGGSFNGDSERQMSGLEMKHLYGSSVRGTWREGFLLEALKDIQRKAREMGTSLCRGTIGEPGWEVRLPGTSRDSKRWLWKWVSLSFCGVSMRGT